MRLAFLFIFCCLLAVGCSVKQSGSGGGPATAGVIEPVPVTEDGNSTMIVTPGNALAGKVALAKPGYVVVTFPIGKVPAADQVLGVYRGGLKVGDIKVTGPRRENNTVADIVSGQGQVRAGDEVWAN